MEIKKSQIKKAGIKFIELAQAFNVSPAMITKMPELIPDQYQYALRFGSKEAQAIRRKTIRHIKGQEVVS